MHDPAVTEALLHEFVADVLAAHNNSYAKATSALRREWPDLHITFDKAFRHLGYRPSEF